MKPRVGISRCLLGDQVRYDGGHKRHPALIERLGPHVEWVPVCPEVEIGMGTPREPVELVSGDRGVRMRGVTSGADWTDAMIGYATARVETLKAMQLSGYVLKSRSPSCGMPNGLFARALLAAMPDLAVAEEGDLVTIEAIDGFLARVRARRKVRDTT